MFVCEIACFYVAFTDIRNTEQGEQEGKEGCGKCEKLPVSLEDLKVICEACDHGFHATHLLERKTGSNTNRTYVARGHDDYMTCFYDHYMSKVFTIWRFCFMFPDS